MSNQITLIPGDGIGPEVAASVKKIFAAAKVDIAWDEVECGIETFERTKELLPKAVLNSLEKTKLGLKGPTTTPIGGGHRSINVVLRQKYNLFANVRPVQSIPGLKCLYPDVNMTIIRENTEDLYMGIEYAIDKNTAHGIKVITRGASERIARYAFEYAKKMGLSKVAVVHKANIMKLTDGLFLDATRTVASNYAGIQLSEVIVDNCCMQLVSKPQQFQVLVTENLYGDILSDLASGLVGGLGVAAGANIGEDMAVFEAVHGSAPDIAGKNLANPTALLMSALMLLEHLQKFSDVEKIKGALFKTLSNEKTRTKDLGGPLTTSAFTECIIANM